MAVYIQKDDGTVRHLAEKDDLLESISSNFLMHKLPDIIITDENLFDGNGLLIPIEKYNALERIPNAQDTLITKALANHIVRAESNIEGKGLMNFAGICGNLLAIAIGCKVFNWGVSLFDHPQHLDKLVNLLSKADTASNYAIPLSIFAIATTLLLYGENHTVDNLEIKSDKITLNIMGDIDALKEVIKSSELFVKSRTYIIERMQQQLNSELARA